MKDPRLNLILRWFKIQKWKPLPFQITAWEKYFQGNSGLIAIPTGAGKTYAAFLAALADLNEQPAKGLQILYLTPLRALASDLEIALQKPIVDLKLPFRVEKRTGDTSYSRRQKQSKNPPEILLTTPESLAIMLSDPQANLLFGNLRAIIVDEWHELMGTKRGVLLELCLARLKKWNPQTRIWGLTATIGNLEEAARVCVGNERSPVLISSTMKRELNLEIILPETLDKLPWAGQLGLRMLPYVLKELSPFHSTLIFTNTRSQAERWHQAIVEAKPEWKEIIGLHHSSIDRQEREKIEKEVKEGSLRFVVCTSSLDLGVDFSPVDKVIQIGSPKSIARLLQRAGRSSHRPMTPCRLAIVPSHALEIAELNAYRMAVEEHIIEKRIPLKKCFDVLFQHVVSCAIGGGFKREELFAEIKTTLAYAELTEVEFDECLFFLMQGGKSLGAYPEYQKIFLEDGLYQVRDRKIIQRHRMSIGTISSDPHVLVKLARGKTLGAIEENFLTGLMPGDHFLFGGKVLELIQYRDLVAYVRLGKQKTLSAAVWQGSRLPFSGSLGKLLRMALDHQPKDAPESLFLEEISLLQNSLSKLPHEEELLLEIFKSREGWHLFIYPFEGKTIHQGLASLIAYRLAKLKPGTFTLSSNDYGFEILSREPFDLAYLDKELFSPENLEEEIPHILNINELAKGFFRDITRIAGLVFQGYPGHQKTNRQIQVSSSLLYDVFKKYDPTNLLFLQSQKEVFEKYFDILRMREVLARLFVSKLVLVHLKRFSPFALPLFIERVSGHLTTETLAERIEKIKASWKRV